MFRKQHPAAGARPGTLLIAADAPPPRIQAVRYNREVVHEETLQDLSRLSRPTSSSSVLWLDVQGFGDEKLLQIIARRFGIHPLAMEDVVNVPQRPKVEIYGDQLLIITRSLALPGRLQIEASQISIILGPNYVLTFQERYGDLLMPVRQRLARRSARLRRNGSDYLAYALLDTVVDATYPVMESLGEQLEELEREILNRPQPEILGRINRVKNQLVNLRRTIWPQRDTARALVQDDIGLISEDVRTFLRDTHDHCVQISEVVEMYRDIAAGLLNTYMSAVAHRSNEVMKVLTIMSSIFVPLTFIAGIYGMNFDNMPELGFRWAYPAVWLTMLAVACGMLGFFHQKGWIRILPLRADAARLSATTPVGDQRPSRLVVLDCDEQRGEDDLPAARRNHAA
jgi:magnesium transporter